MKFRYSLDYTSLTENDRIFYEANGFLIKPKLFEKNALGDYIRRFEDICRGADRSLGMTVMRDVSQRHKTDSVYKLQDFQYDEVLFGYCQHPAVLNIVEAFTGPNICAYHTMLIAKPPDSGSLTSRHPLHQDLHYFPFRPADRIVCAWTALENVSRANGCLVAIPGSHKGRLLPHDYPETWNGKVNKAFHGIQNFDVKPTDLTYLEMEAGDTVFFHPLLIHGSGANRTSGLRKAISCHYGPSDVTFIDVRGTTQENIGEEVMDMARKRLGDDVKLDYATIWKLRSRIVQSVTARL